MPIMRTLTIIQILVVTICLWLQAPLFVVYGQSDGLKVIVENKGQSGEVCVSPEYGCLYIGSGEILEFVFPPNEIQVGEEFTACLDGICKTGINGPEHEPEYIYFESEGIEEIGPQSVDEESSSPTSIRSDIIAFFLLILFSGIVIIIYKIRRRSRRRRYFSAETIRVTFRKQDYKCANCKKGITTILYDKHHKDGNRANNSASNLELLCVSCHAKITRGLLDEEEQEEKRRSKWKFVAVGIIILFIIFWGLWELNN
jgi:hypothetical protein